MKPLRIVAHNGAPLWGGAESALVRLLAGLNGRGHEVKLYANHPEVVRRARDAGLDAQRRHLGGDLAIHHAVALAFRFRADRPDAVILGTFRKVWLGALAARLAGVHRVVARVGLETDTPRNAKYRFVFRHWVHAAVFNAHGMRRRFAAALPGYEERATTIHTGVTPPDVGGGRRFREELGIPPDAPLIGSVGRLAEQKRYDRLLGALALLPTVHGVMVGEGPERPMLERAARTLGVEGRAHFPGFREVVGPALDAMDLFVISSDREGMSNAMLEALAAGVPVVSTDVSGAREALAPLDDEAPGVVVDPTPAALAATVEDLLRAPDRVATMATVARRVARERFGEERMLDEWEAVLRGA